MESNTARYYMGRSRVAVVSLFKFTRCLRFLSRAKDLVLAAASVTVSLMRAPGASRFMAVADPEKVDRVGQCAARSVGEKF